MVQWIQSIPGGFISTNSKLAGIKVWNVSNPLAPLRTIRAGRAGIVNIVPLRDTSLGRDSFLLSFKNGQVGVFNLKAEKFEFMIEANHSETIFDCRFKHDDKDTLATCSFDGCIRIWDVKTMKCLKILNSNSN